MHVLDLCFQDSIALWNSLEILEDVVIPKKDFPSAVYHQKERDLQSHHH